MKNIIIIIIIINVFHSIIMFLKFERIQKLFTSICCIGNLEKHFMLIKKI